MTMLLLFLMCFLNYSFSFNFISFVNFTIVIVSFCKSKNHYINGNFFCSIYVVVKIPSTKPAFPLSTGKNAFFTWSRFHYKCRSAMELLCIWHNNDYHRNIICKISKELIIIYVFPKRCAKINN